MATHLWILRFQIGADFIRDLDLGRGLVGEVVDDIKVVRAKILLKYMRDRTAIVNS